MSRSKQKQAGRNLTPSPSPAAEPALSDTSSDDEQRDSAARVPRARHSSQLRKAIRAELPPSPFSPGRSRNNMASPGPEGHDASEVEVLQRRITDLIEEKKHSDEVLAALTEQNWQYLIDRSERIKAKFDREMTSLISDVHALCEFSQQQKLRAQTPSTTRSRSSSQSSDQGTSPAAAVVPAGSSSSGGGGRNHSGDRDSSTKAKEFVWRDSQLTSMFRASSDIKTVYNMFVAVLILFAMKVFINDYFKSKDADDADAPFHVSIVTVLFASFGKLHVIIPFWWTMFATHCLLLPIMWAWRQQRINDYTYSALYVLHQCLFLFGYGWVISKLELPIASSLIVLCEQTRMIMKAHSFWRETLRIKHHPLETPKGVIRHGSNSVANSTLLPTFREQAAQFLLFHFVPTLIYRNSYPRTRYIRWSFVGGRFLECLGCIFYLYILFANFCIPEYQATAAEPGDARALFVSLFNSVLPGIATYLLAFFGLLHCWMNMWAELTRFADRLFYLDWWNTTSFSSYYRKWNMIVHDSLYNYIYVDLRRLGMPQGACFFLTFLVSAVMHEYIISLSLKFFYPVLLVMFLGFGVFFVYVTKHLGTTGRMWNVFFWTNLIIGNGMLLLFYSREYYARQPAELQRTGGPEVAHVFQYDTNSWLPHSWQPFLTVNATA